MARQRPWLARQVTVIGALVADAGWSLSTRRFQATLSAVGIASSIAGVVLLVGVSRGIERFTLEQIESAGGRVLVVAATPDTSPSQPSLPATLRLGDERAVLANRPEFDLASAENATNATIQAGTRSVSGLETRGITADGFDVLGLRAARGRLLTSREFETGARAVVLGAHLARSLFPQASALGQTVTIGEWPFVVVGVAAWVGDPVADLRSGLDETAYVPYRAAADAFHGSDAARTLRLRLRRDADERTAALELRAALDRQRQQRGEMGGDLRLTNTIERRRFFDRILMALQVLIGVVGGVGLIVGAIGVANVLLVSVRERTAEIGLRRAFGATRSAVFAGLLLEALAITVSGGLVGLLVALATSRMAVLFPQVPASARPDVGGSLGLVVLGLVVAVGLAAGVAPARRAASVYPAEALRSE